MCGRFPPSHSEVVMLRLRAFLLFAATVVVIAASEAQFGQPGGFPTSQQTPIPLAVGILPGIDDVGVIGELKLSDEQVKKLVVLRQEEWDEAYTTTPKKLAEGAGARAEASDAFLKKTLTEAQ